jgi:hypothetical protein
MAGGGTGRPEPEADPMTASATPVVRDARNRGYAVVLAGTVAYAGVAARHFWEHSQLRDPDLPHLLLLVANIVVLGGVPWVGVAGWLLTPRVPPR